MLVLYLSHEFDQPNPDAVPCLPAVDGLIGGKCPHHSHEGNQELNLVLILHVEPTKVLHHVLTVLPLCRFSIGL